MCNNLFPLENNFHTAENNSGKIQAILSFIHVFTSPVKIDLVLMYQHHFSNHKLSDPLFDPREHSRLQHLGFPTITWECVSSHEILD